ncbi:MAG: hypothetical protein Q4G67_14230 [Actinomycetia bacterium]|nr:hypothetical protein [Actinomycetes bacterium]
MPKAITIRNVPDDVVTELSVRAARGGRSLQEFLRGHLIDYAHATDLEVWLDGARHEATRLDPVWLSAQEIVGAVRADRP